ncbi:MAG TPA: TetR/AcrR family transcriptional regulator [Terrimicrobium sp.]
MARKKTRPYRSAVRNEQRQRTANRIIGAAGKLFRAKGFEGVSIEEIALAAGVSTPTVYAVFGSKRGILREWMVRALFNDAYQVFVARALGISEPQERLRAAAAIARQVYDSERSQIGLLRGAAILSPELTALERETEAIRFERQESTVQLLRDAKALRTGMSYERAREIFWTLTGRDIYRMLVVEKRWSSDEYEKWLGNLLVLALLKEPHRAGGGGAKG